VEQNACAAPSAPAPRRLLAANDSQRVSSSTLMQGESESAGARALRAPLSVMVVDIDLFKNVSDHKGILRATV
jgi:GGDEF domain-containing protein